MAQPAELHRTETAVEILIERYAGTGKSDLLCAYEQAVKRTVNLMDKPFECITSFSYGIEVGDRKELVRCKDCKWASGHEDGRFAKPFHCRKYRDFHEGDWFCKDGEPKGE